MEEEEKETFQVSIEHVLEAQKVWEDPQKIMNLIDLLFLWEDPDKKGIYS